MTDNEFESAVTAFVIGLCLGVLIFVGIEVFAGRTYHDGIQFNRQQAIDSGVAEWVIDPKTGEKSFEFITEVGDDEPAGITQ